MLARFVIVALGMCGAVRGFAPSSVRASRALRPVQAAKGDGAIVVVNDDSVKSTVSLVGALAGFTLGGPVLAAVGAAGANYIANKVYFEGL
jgi:outer membrane lipoprotein SlyB